MFEKFNETIKTNNLIEKNDTILMGVSGGADSVYLFFGLLSLKEKYNLNLKCAHINHGIRESAKRDELYVKSLCDKYDVEFNLLSTNMNEYALKEKLSKEEAGRKLRYDFFNKIATSKAKIALAHNFDDNMETILFRIIRGTGISGLRGIPYKRDNIIRPLLDTKRQTIEEELKKLGIPWMLDETNLINDYSRNMLRNELIPFVEKNFNTSFKESLNRLRLNSTEIYDFISKETKAYTNKNYLEVEKVIDLDQGLLNEVIRTFILRNKNNLNSIDRNHIEAFINLMKSENGKSINLPGINLYKHDDKIFAQGKTIDRNESSLNLGENFTDFGKFELSKDKLNGEHVIVIDYESINGNLKVTKRESGDRFNPIGLKGSKKLKDFFNDIKISPFLRNEIPIIRDEKDIVWVVPYRMSENNKIKEDTKNKLWIKWEEK
ncbi:tRNA(Ile)-lysidine synthase [Peptoniphilus koenoeneniae]|uniref:tRNA(Ile)-lysidine synthase n=1 Tax=Peptoniphilus koenoeneniae TaxID=507751 RepID=A0ABU0AUI1_9FIRM|nr:MULTISPECIES: tRNA lysidine(34) synthetase TilS [Peptoniphilus]ERT56698.1 tRNA(Ile)-lysidine synthetase [Peptoniphilus sp. BV3C26]MDQ0274098.1 tRNA(Ile)-lysidine synthase [Peptoniphilus koenoeneniae]